MQPIVSENKAIGGTREYKIKDVQAKIHGLNQKQTAHSAQKYRKPQ
jgi:hypothetical protein